MIGKLLKLSAIIVMFFAIMAPGKAQDPLMETDVTVFERPYEPLTTSMYSASNYWYKRITLSGIPWNIVYNGVPYNSMYISTYGGICFGNSPAITPSTSSQDYFNRYNYNFLYAFWVRSDGRSSSSPYGQVKIGVTGVAPERVLIVEIINQDIYRYSSYESSDINYQVRFYEKNNIIEYHYGAMSRGNKSIGVSQSYGYGTVLIGFSAKSATTNWINVDPNGNGNTGYNNWEVYRYGESGSGGHGKYSTVRNNNDFAEVTPGTVVQFGPKKPRIDVAWPSEDEILVRPYQYGNSGNPDRDAEKPGVVIENVAASDIPPGKPVTYEIAGPLTFPVHPNYQTIYSWSGNLGNGETRFSSATGPGAGAAGSLNLSDASINGGLYELNGTVEDNGEIENYGHLFYIANTYDLEISKVIDPKDLNEKKYPLTARVPVKLRLTNRGITDITNFILHAYIYDENDVLVHEDDYEWTADPGQELSLGGTVDIIMDQFRPTDIGNFRLEAYAEYLGDEAMFNNYYPWQGQPDHIFTIAPEIEASAVSVVVPNNENDFGNNVEIFVGRPIDPQARFQNNGITDISNAPTEIVIKHLPDMEVVYTDNAEAQDIPQGQINNQGDVIYDVFEPPMAGTYQVCVTISALDDDITDNNTICDTFEVIDALNGIYTIGPDKNTGNEEADNAYNERNFTSVQEALDALYLHGVTGPVAFEFTASNYNVGDMTLTDLRPSMDLRSKIIGMSEVNNVTFRPSTEKSLAKGNVTIHLYSASGIGIIFGQATKMNNENAVVNNLPESRAKEWANSDGYFTFDGGSQKAIKFVLHTNAVLNAAFYLGQGASNNQVKNCIITSANPAASWDDCSLPITAFSEPQFTFEQDSRAAGTQSYSTGIVMRSIPPQDDINYFDPDLPVQAAINSVNLDTLVNMNNVIANNEISGFAYGVVSLGIGPLMRDGITRRYYNENNEISGNYIHDVSRAGIFLGHEENTDIMNNKISGVASSVTGYNAGYDVAGIMAGGEKAGIKLGYNNIGLNLNANEISNVGEAVSSATPHYIYGIKVEQSRNTYQFTSYPNEAENTVISNNAIWGIRSANTNSVRCGIRLFTERNQDAGSWDNIMITPLHGTYFTREDKIVNNTIIMDDDGYNTAGPVAGIALQQVDAAELYNNAIAMLDDNNAGATNLYGAIMYQGVHPNEPMGLKADRNVYWLKGNGTVTDSSALYRFMYVNENSELINIGDRNEFLTMNQWQMYTGSQDYNSTLYNFTNDLTSPNVDDPASMLRIKDNPSWPVGSKLNNLGMKLDYVVYDIDNNERGTLGQRFDIGAFEFPGVMLNSDIEVTTAHQPGSYRSTINAFSDAEYVMTEAPVEVKAELRNNGSLAQTGVDITVNIYRENPAGGFYDEPELTETKKVTVPTTETIELEFDLADGEDKEFYPSTYNDFNTHYANRPAMADSLYPVPEWFTTMANNVTPLYRIVITAAADEDVANNVYDKAVRFYLKRSELNMIISVENSPYEMDGASSDDVRAGHRNADSLMSYLKFLGWENEWIMGEADTTLVMMYDVFERTGWEPRAVDYTIWRTMMWSDADENPLTREQMLDISDFSNSGNTNIKKNLVIASQEMSRINYAGKEDFVKEILRVWHQPGYPTDPLDGPSYNAGETQPAYNLTDDTKYIVGENIGRLRKQYVMKTGILPADPDPVPGLMSVWPTGSGIASVAYKYNEEVVAGPDPLETTMGSAVTTLSQNTAYLGVDWRHFTDGEEILRGILDFFSKNGGNIVPVELLSFDAENLGGRVELSWETATEFNTDRFEIERAAINAGELPVFVKIDEVQAAGTSGDRQLYGPVYDYKLSANTTYQYRLKMVDLDGQYEYSDVIEIQVAGAAIQLGEAVPNPASSYADIKYTLDTDRNVLITLYDMNGKEVKTLFNGFAKAGENDLTIDLSGINSGVYSYVLKTGDSMFTKYINVIK